MRIVPLSKYGRKSLGNMLSITGSAQYKKLVKLINSQIYASFAKNVDTDEDAAKKFIGARDVVRFMKNLDEVIRSRIDAIDNTEKTS